MTRRRVVSFNVNGLRARPHQLQAVIASHAPLVLGLQETKVADDAFPFDTPEHGSLHTVIHGQKGHFGVALMSPDAPEDVLRGLPTEPPTAQRRFISARYALPDGRPLWVLNGYFPQGESRDHPEKFPYKAGFYRDLLDHLEKNHDPSDALLLMGDMNVAPSDTDIGIGEDNRKRWLREGKCCFLPEEREWLDALLSWGLHDTFRHRHPDVDDRFSWFDYRSRGFEREPPRGLRIDLILATRPLLEICTAADIDYDIRGMEKPSDHCPVWAEFEL